MIQSLKQWIKAVLIITVIFSFGQSNSYGQIGRLKKVVKSKLTQDKGEEKREGEVIPQKAEHEEDQGILNETHKNNIGKIVWSNEVIDMTNPDSTKFENHFSATEQIYGRFYLSQSIENSIIDEIGKSYGEYAYFYDVYVDGKIVDWKMDKGRNYGESLHRTTQKVFVYDDGEFCDRAGWTKLVNSLEPGKHEIKVDLRAKHYDQLYNTIYAFGSFELIKKEGDVIKIGKSYSTIEAGMVDKELESGMLSCIQNYAKNSGWDEIFSKVKIQSKDWNIVRNRNSGIILGRTLVAYCFASWPDGHCTLQRFVFM